MQPTLDRVIFTLADLQGAARVILAANPVPILTYRMQHEVLHVPPAEPELERVKKAAIKNK